MRLEKDSKGNWSTIDKNGKVSLLLIGTGRISYA